MALIQTNNAGKVAYSKSGTTNVRASYNLDSAVIYSAAAPLKLGTLTGLTWQIEGQWTWFEIVTTNGKTGWVRHDVFTLTPSTATTTTTAPQTSPGTYTGPDPIITPTKKSSGLDMAILGLGAIVVYKLLNKKK